MVYHAGLSYLCRDFIEVAANQGHAGLFVCERPRDIYILDWIESCVNEQSRHRIVLNVFCTYPDATYVSAKSHTTWYTRQFFNNPPSTEKYKVLVNKWEFSSNSIFCDALQNHMKTQMY